MESVAERVQYHAEDPPSYNDAGQLSPKTWNVRAVVYVERIEALKRDLERELGMSVTGDLVEYYRREGVLLWRRCPMIGAAVAWGGRRGDDDSDSAVVVSEAANILPLVVVW
jgi:hypothetical protein